MSALSFFIDDEQALVALGERLADACRPGMSLYLSGELGAGKTTLARGIARGLGHEGAVKSPTYTLVEPYLELRIPVYHFDLYRLADAEELEFMGIRDYLDADALVVVEWPERGQGVLPPPDLAITIEVSGGARRVEMIGEGEAGEQCLIRLSS